MDVVLCGTPAHWWDTHKEDLTFWDKVQPTMMHRFVAPPEWKAQDTLGDKDKNVNFFSLGYKLKDNSYSSLG